MSRFLLGTLGHLTWVVGYIAVALIAGVRPNPAVAQSSPLISKSYGAASLVVGQSTSLTFEIVATDALTGVGFTDSLPDGLVVESPNGFTGFNPTDGCAGGTVTATPGSGSIRLSGAKLAASTSGRCSFSVDVVGTQPGSWSNTVTVLSDTGPGNTSSAAIMVDRGLTTVDINSSADTSTFGQSVAFTATVTVSAPGKGFPTGTVNFTDGSAILDTVALPADGVARFFSASLPVGIHTIAAEYTGEASFARSASRALTKIVAKGPTTITLTSSTNLSRTDQSITLRAIVEGFGRAPTGMVSFHVGPAALGSIALSPDSTATLIATLPSGRHPITAVYSGDANYVTSAAPPLIVAVNLPQVPLNDPWPTMLVLLLVIVLVGFLLTVRKFAFRGIGRLFQLLRRIIAGIRRALSPIRALRRFGFLSPKAVKPSVLAESAVGLGMGAVTRALAGGTETESAIAANNFDPTSIDLHPTRQLFFTWISPAAGKHQPYLRSVAEADDSKIKHFFSTSIPINTNPLNLYDDIESAFTVDMFQFSDKKCFYALFEFKRSITSNVMILAVLFSIILCGVLIANVFLSTFFDLYGSRLTEKNYLPISFDAFVIRVVFDEHEFNKFMFGMISCVVAYVVILIIHFTGYKPAQQLNGQRLNTFLIEYLANISKNFDEIRTSAVQIIVEGKDAEQMRGDTVLWSTSLQWMGFRTFFIEQYLRNMLFQVRRNSGYYLLFVPLTLVVAVFFTAWLLGIRQMNLFDSSSELYHQNGFYLFFILLLWSAFRYLRYSVSFVVKSIEGSEWFKFGQLELQNAMTRIMHTYVTHLWDWKGKFSRSELG